MQETHIWLKAEMQKQASDPFDDLLGLEEQYFADGHALGVQDGSKAGRIEGRIFGLEKGFEKYLVMGELAGQCSIWRARLHQNTRNTQNADNSEIARVKPIASSDRLTKHIETLSALVDAETLSHQNTEDDVAEFDERLKLAQGKARVIANIVNPASSNTFNVGGRRAAATVSRRQDTSNMEDFEIRGRMI